MTLDLADRVLDDVMDAFGLDEETTTEAGRAMALRVIRAALSEAEDSAVQGEMDARADNAYRDGEIRRGL